ncbi:MULTISPECIES: hypothetical protein [Natrialbaceae]|uniref:hypothetical protein n=1 Tax=Natrialbaceae TaxID=1644061 RepID=UPI00207C5A83|nr:hypothetical protein [Natronococcus sp. CG52]
MFGAETVNLVSTMSEVSAAFFAIPPLLLFPAGVVVRAGSPRLPATSAAKHGLTVAAGYLPVALAGAIVFTASGGGSAGPTPPSAIFVAGPGYPAAFGPAGAVVGNYL